MVLREQVQLTIEQFDEFVQKPENANRRFEYVGGEVIEVVSRWYSSFVASVIMSYVSTFILQNRLGIFTGADGGYIVEGERYIPDVGFIRTSRMKGVRIDDIYIPNAPDLAVEVISPSNQVREISVKVTNYLAAGTIVWVVYPDQEEVHIHRPNQAVEVLKGEKATLNGETILPNFKLKLADIFLPPEEIESDEEA